MSKSGGGRKLTIQRKDAILPNIAVSISRQSSRYNLVPTHLDYTGRYNGSVGKLQHDVETQKIKIPACGVYIRSERLSKREEKDVFFLITAQNLDSSSVNSNEIDEPVQHSAKSEATVWQHKGAEERSWRFYSPSHNEQLNRARKQEISTIKLDAGKEQWIVDLTQMQHRTMGKTAKRQVRCIDSKSNVRPSSSSPPAMSPEEEVSTTTLQFVLHQKLAIGQIKRCEYNLIRRLSIENAQPNEVLFCGYTYPKAVATSGKRNRKWSCIRRENNFSAGGYRLEHHGSFAAFNANGKRKPKPKLSIVLQDCAVEFTDYSMQIDIRISKSKKESIFVADRKEYLGWQALLRYVMHGDSDKPCIFGVPLCAEHVPKHIVSGDIKVPAFVAQCCGLLSQYGLQTPSLFRIPGDDERCLKLVQTYEECDNVDLNAVFSINPANPSLSKRDAYNVASLLKMYLMKLPIPLIPTDHYHSFLQYGKLIKMKRKTLEKTVSPVEAVDPAVILRPAVFSLPPAHRHCLNFLIRFLVQLTANSKVNKMTPQAIGVCLAPTLLQPPPSDSAHMEANPTLALQDAAVCTQVISDMINNVDLIFKEDKEEPKTSTDAPPATALPPSPPLLSVEFPFQSAPSDAQTGAEHVSVFDKHEDEQEVVDALSAEMVETDMSTAQYAVTHGAQSIAQWRGCQTVASYPVLTYRSDKPRVNTESRALEYSSQELTPKEVVFMHSKGQIFPIQICDDGYSDNSNEEQVPAHTTST